MGDALHDAAAAASDDVDDLQVLEGHVERRAAVPAAAFGGGGAVRGPRPGVRRAVAVALAPDSSSAPSSSSLDEVDRARSPSSRDFPPRFSPSSSAGESSRTARLAPVGVATPARLAPVGVGAGAVGVPTPGDAKAPPVDLELALAERARVGEVVRARVVVRGGQRDGHVLAVERHRGEPGWIVAAAFLDARRRSARRDFDLAPSQGKRVAAVALDHTARSRRVAVAGMSARRTQRAFTLDDEDDDYDVSYVPGISAPPDASTSPRSPAKAAVASHIGSGALIRSTTAAERIQGRFRTWMREKRERLRSAAARVGAAAASSSSSAGGAAGGAPSTPRPPPAQRYARIDSDSDSDHEDTRAARAKHHRAASAGAGRPAGHAPTADGVAADDRPADDDGTRRVASW